MESLYPVSGESTTFPGWIVPPKAKRSVGREDLRVSRTFSSQQGNWIFVEGIGKSAVGPKIFSVEELSDQDILLLVEKSGAFSFLDDPEEDIYSTSDGIPLR